MGFDKDKFMASPFAERTEDVPVPAMKEFFAEGDAIVWRVRGLTGEQMGFVRETSERNKNIMAVLEGLAEKNPKEITKFIKQITGESGALPQDVAKRLEILVQGSVDPVCDIELSIKVCRTFPGEHYMLTQKILELTGLGQIPGKVNASGVAPKSKQ